MADFFVSYNSADKDWAEWIAWTLEEAGYSVIIQAWDFRPGDDFIVKMQEAARTASKTIAVLSENYLKAKFNVSGQSAATHVIHKVLLDKRGPRTFLQILEQIHEYEQLFFMQMMLDRGTRPADQTRRELRARFMDRICSMPDPRRVHMQHIEQQTVITGLRREDPDKLHLLSRKLHELFELYGIGNPALPGNGALYPRASESPCWRPVAQCSRREWVTWTP